MTAATKEKAKFAKGDKVRVLSGDWGNGNRGTVESGKGEFVMVVLEGHKDPLEFKAGAVEKL